MARPPGMGVRFKPDPVSVLPFATLRHVTLTRSFILCFRHCAYRDVTPHCATYCSMWADYGRADKDRFLALGSKRRPRLMRCPRLKLSNHEDIRN
jgi:hypothetical protein